MYPYNLIGRIAKWRFLQSEASLWSAGNRVVEFLFFIGTIMFLYFDNFVFDDFKYFKYIGIVIALYSLGTIRHRSGLYDGYFDGYEQGFMDSATCNCDYWGSKDFTGDEELAIAKALAEIELNEKNISEANMLARAEEIKKGHSKLLGWILTWRKVA